MKKQETEFAKGKHTPEMITSCRQIVANNGSCAGVGCVNCPGYSLSNEGSGCHDNGWTGEGREYKATRLKNVTAYLANHSKPAPRVPEIVQKRLNYYQVTYDDLATTVLHKRQELANLLQDREIAKAAYAAAKRKAKEYTK